MSKNSFTDRGFSEQKLALLASLLEDEGVPQAPTLKRVSRDGELPLSSAQMRLWLVDQLEPGSAAYNIPVCHWFKGHLDLVALERSLSEIVRRHEVLRAYYLRVDGRPVQKIAPPELFRIPVVDVQGLPDAAREPEVASLASADARQPFDLGQAPLMRARLLKLAPDEHVLLLNLHHIAFDWWSFGVFEKELAVVYDAFVRGEEASPLPELPFQYVDFAAWQRQRQQGEILQAQLDYWQKKLSGALPALELPTDQPRPAVQTYNGSIFSSVLSKRLTEALKILSQREGVTLFATLLGAFKVLLQRYTGQDDILVGVPIAGRNRAETEGLIGFFVNNLVMRTDLSGDPTFRQLLRRVQETTLGAYAHQDLPFEKLVEVLNPKRDSSRSPMFQVMLSMLNTPMQPLRLPGLQHRRTMMDSGTSKFDLTLFAMEEAKGLTLTCEYNTDLFHADRIERMLGHFEVLLEGIVGDPDRRLSELPLLTTEEHQQLLIGWNDTRVTYPQDVLLHQLFEAQVERTPEAVAVEYAGKQLTYSELNQLANQLAHYLRTLGVGPDTLVGICMERSLELVVALYGVLKAGGAYVPIDPEYPQERISYMLEDAALSVLLTQRGIVGRLPRCGAKTFCLDDGWEQIAAGDTANPAKVTSPRNLAYMIYTSGSTGKPKGAMNTHQAICNRLLWMQSQYHLTEADRILQKTPASFDVSVWEFFWPLLTGARLVLAKPGGHQDPAYLVSLITEQRITVTHFVPSMLAIFLSEPGVERCASLRHVICSGEALSFNLQEQFFKQSSAQLHNLYGPTETAVDVTHWTCQLDDQRNMVPIGRPVANTQIYILNEHMQPVPIGVSGDLYIGGVQVGRGYHNRPDLTAEKFIPDPFSADPEARIYKTGDLCRWLSDGNVEYLGRSDFQIKVRGLRIELGEIETILGRNDAVRQCVVVAREDATADKLLVAYVEPRQPGHAPIISDLRAHLRKELPEYMVPSVFVVMENLPLSPNGKIDRKALPPPSYDNVPGAHDSVAPRTENEKALAAILTEVLKVAHIDIHDNFFDLGGHSLLAIRVVSRIRDVFEVDLPPSTFFANSTVAALARVLADAKGNGESIQRIERRNQDGPCPLSFAQERLWFLDQLAPGSPVYNIVDVVAFKGKYNAKAMQRAVNELVQRHETLRTAFSHSDGQAVQIVLPTVDIVLPELDLRQLSKKEQEDTWINLAREEGQKPFNLAQPPLLRGTLVLLSEQNQLLLLAIHHIIADEWSMEVLQRELRQMYSMACLGEPSSLPELPIRYTDFVHWQRGYLQGKVLQKQMSFWKEALAGAPTILELPTDKPRPILQSFRGATEAFELPKELLERLKLLSRQQEATLFMTLEAAFMALLHRYTGQDDILVGTPISGRTRSETEGLIGLFLNIVILRAQVSDQVSFQSLLRQVRQRALGAYGHQDLPFEQLVAELAPERYLSRTPLFQVMFVLFSADAASQASDVAGLSQLATGTSKFDLTLAVSETEAGLRGLIEYRTDLFEVETIRRLGGHYATLLDAITRDSDQLVSALPILPHKERQQLLVDWNNTVVAHPERDLYVHRMIAERARQNPDQVALICEEQQFTYDELERRSNQLAHHLQSLGVGPEVLVGLLVERSLEMVVGLLGILKAGGAYVPLDPAFPQSRLAYMIADSRMRVLVTHRELDEMLPVRPPSILHLDTDWEKIARQDTANPKSPRTLPDNLAYILYTSGSTGTPKGVEIPHSAVVNFLLSMQREPGFTAKDRLLAVTTLSFDIAGLEIYLPLVSGGTTVIASREDNYDPAQLMERIRESQCTMMQATPATWRALLDAGWEGSKNLKLLCGGEALPGDLAQALLPRCAELWNMYGPTETTIWSTIHKVTSVDGPVPIGRPIANTQVFILDGHRQLVPAGIIGELYIGGSGLARGYFARPELTAERFVDSPFEPHARLYRTGDLARWLSDGTIECLGRVDNQVKIRGFRIESGEVESALARHEAVEQCVVVAREDEPGNKLLVAYYEPKPGMSPAISDLRAHLRKELPEYMVPSVFVVMEKLPLTPNGKIDRKALPPPTQYRIEVSGGIAAPRDSIEQMLVQIWSRILRVSSIGIHDNFFDLGGHSLLAVRIMTEIERLVKRRLPLATFLQAPTIGDLADALRKEDWKPCWSSLTPIRAGGSKPPLFLMHSHGGNVLEYYPLAKHLESDQPVYALQARGLDGHIIKDQSFEHMVKAYLRELRSLQPEGPYFLGGYCLGGLLALEAAQQLSALGEQVALVALIQSINPIYARFDPNLTLLKRCWYRTTKRIDLELEHLYHRGSTHILERCRRTWDISLARTAITFDNWMGNGSTWPKHRSMAYTLEMLGIEHDKARLRYVPRPYSGPVVLFRARKQLSGLMTDVTLGWKDVLGNLEIYEVPGHQETMLQEPNVPYLAEELTARLLAAQHSRKPPLIVECTHSLA